MYVTAMEILVSGEGTSPKVVTGWYIHDLGTKSANKKRNSGHCFGFELVYVNTVVYRAYLVIRLFLKLLLTVTLRKGRSVSIAHAKIECFVFPTALKLL